MTFVQNWSKWCTACNQCNTALHFFSGVGCRFVAANTENDDVGEYKTGVLVREEHHEVR